MGQLGSVYENNVLDAILGPGFTKPATVYVALFLQTPTPTFAGIEVVGGSYARVAVTNNTTNWPAASSSQKSNGTTITFTTTTASWGIVTSFGLYDLSTSGNLICYGDLQQQVQVITGVTPVFQVGALVITAQ